jgi:hypothetical protein
MWGRTQELQEFRSYRSSSARLVRKNGRLLAGIMLQRMDSELGKKTGIQKTEFRSAPKSA